VNADDYVRMTDEERAEFLRHRHHVALAVTAAVTIVMILLTLFFIDYYADTPMCGTGQDHGPC
jgi:hypothetical protein